MEKEVVQLCYGYFWRLGDVASMWLFIPERELFPQ
jgi:hypothetical protein